MARGIQCRPNAWEYDFRLRRPLIIVGPRRVAEDAEVFQEIFHHDLNINQRDHGFQVFDNLRQIMLGVTPGHLAGPSLAPVSTLYSPGREREPPRGTQGVPMSSLTDIPGIRVGHATDLRGITGCTVVLCEAGAVASGEVRGAAPGTLGTSLLEPSYLVQKIHGVLLTGGSAFGLAAADGVMRYLEERGVGLDTRAARVPIVVGAVIFDLGIGDPRARPDAAMGYAACAAATAAPVLEGSVGAGTGATVGKVLGPEAAMKGGLGSWSLRLYDGTTVGALVVVNALGDVVDEDGRIVAGCRGPDGQFADSARTLIRQPPHAVFATNTTLAVVATSAAVTKNQARRLAVQGHAGLSRAIRPSHTLFDGDVVFALGTGADGPSDQTSLGEAAAQAVAEAARRAVRTARGLGGVPGLAAAGDR